MLELLKKLHNDEEGQDLIEYALLAGVLVAGLTAASSTWVASIRTKLNNIVSAIPNN